MRLVSLLVCLLFALSACAPLNIPDVKSILSPATATSAPVPSDTPQPAIATTTPTRSSTPTPTSPPGTPTVTPTPEVYHVVAVTLNVHGSTLALPEVDAGATAVIDLAFNPVVLSIMRRSDGTATSFSTAAWQNAQIGQFRYCFAAGTGCQPPKDWQAFQPTVSTKVQVDWLGQRPFFLWAEFRDPTGNIILSTSKDSPLPKAQTTSGLIMISKFNTATPLAKLPPPVMTALAGTRMAFPLTGSVLVNEGRCCAGGKAGSKITLTVKFQATSPNSTVSDMKVQVGGGCVSDPAQLKGGWEPFLPTRNYETSLAGNWVGWYISVQYRDAAGQLSPVYCDDISLEGSP
jgi:hypothetical protein